MSVETVQTVASTMAKAIKSKNYDELLGFLTDDVDVKASVMGKKYEFVGHEKLTKFLGNMPAGLGIDVNKILDDGDGKFTVKVSMGMGFMKMPSKWNVVVNADQKISHLVIN